MLYCIVLWVYTKRTICNHYTLIVHVDGPTDLQKNNKLHRQQLYVKTNSTSTVLDMESIDLKNIYIYDTSSIYYQYGVYVCMCVYRPTHMTDMNKHVVFVHIYI